jgi:histidyl-tRNA synthetase
MRAQMREANRQNARFALIVGESELGENSLAVKNMESGEQEVLPVSQAIQKLKMAEPDAVVADYFGRE